MDDDAASNRQLWRHRPGARKWHLDPGCVTRLRAEETLGIALSRNDTGYACRDCALDDAWQLAVSQTGPATLTVVQLDRELMPTWMSESEPATDRLLDALERCGGGRYVDGTVTTVWGTLPLPAGRFVTSNLPGQPYHLDVAEAVSEPVVRALLTFIADGGSLDTDDLLRAALSLVG